MGATPDVDIYPHSQDVVIGDESGACPEALSITIMPGNGTSDSLPQTSDNAVVLNAPLASVRLRRGASKIWKVV